MWTGHELQPGMNDKISFSCHRLGPTGYMYMKIYTGYKTYSVIISCIDLYDKTSTMSYHAWWMAKLMSWESWMAVLISVNLKSGQKNNVGRDKCFDKKILLLSRGVGTSKLSVVLLFWQPPPPPHSSYCR